MFCATCTCAEHICYLFCYYKPPYTFASFHPDHRFPVSEYPVIALSGAPAAFPVSKENKDLHQYLQWSKEIDDQANSFIEEHLPEGPFVGVHMRHGSDWVSLSAETSHKYTCACCTYTHTHTHTCKHRQSRTMIFDSLNEDVHVRRTTRLQWDTWLFHAELSTKPYAHYFLLFFPSTYPYMQE